MDGIGGIVVGNMFKINEDILPKGYKGTDSIGAKIAYVVTEVGTSINSNNDWITKLGAKFIILDKPEGAESSKWDDIKNTIIKTAVTVVDIEKLQELGQQIIKNAAILFAKRDKVGASPYPGDLSFNAKYRNAEIPIEAMVSVENGGLKRYGGKYLLHPEAANQYILMKEAAQKAGIKWTITSAYRDRAHQASLGSGKTIAGVGSSPHGWGGALDFGELYRAVIPVKGDRGAPSANATVRNNNPLYIWLAENGPKYGWYNPYRLADNTGTDEAWHFEYWGPNVYPSGAIVKSSTPPSTKQPTVLDDVNAILIGGLDTRTGDYSIDEQVSLLKKGYGKDAVVKGFRYNTDKDEIISYLYKHPKVTVFMFSAGCNKADQILIKEIEKTKVYIIEPYAENGNSHVSKAVQLGVPASNVFVGPVKARGKGVVEGASSSNVNSHWDALEQIGKIAK
jgi:LAS superfamily LD-carboxypeptidase LdcB